MNFHSLGSHKILESYRYTFRVDNSVNNVLSTFWKGPRETIISFWSMLILEGYWSTVKQTGNNKSYLSCKTIMENLPYVPSLRWHLHETWCPNEPVNCVFGLVLLAVAVWKNCKMPDLYAHYDILPPKNENFQINSIFFFFFFFFFFFHISAQNIDCGYLLKLPRWGGSNKYPQSMFLSEIG